MKKILIVLFIGGLLGSMGTLLGLRFAPKISKYGIAIQKKVCPMFKVSDNNYRALEIKRNALKKANSEMKKRINRLKNDSIFLRVSEKFLSDLSRGFYQKFRKPIWATKKFYKENANGVAVDIKKRGLSKKELAWVRKYLMTYEVNGLIEATEESIQPNFHIMVLADYKKLN